MSLLCACHFGDGHTAAELKFILCSTMLSQMFRTLKPHHSEERTMAQQRDGHKSQMCPWALKYSSPKKKRAQNQHLSNASIVLKPKQSSQKYLQTRHTVPVLTWGDVVVARFFHMLNINYKPETTKQSSSVNQIFWSKTRKTNSYCNCWEIHYLKSSVEPLWYCILTIPKFFVCKFSFNHIICVLFCDDTLPRVASIWSKNNFCLFFTTTLICH